MLHNTQVSMMGLILVILLMSLNTVSTLTHASDNPLKLNKTNTGDYYYVENKVQIDFNLERSGSVFNEIFPNFQSDLSSFEHKTSSFAALLDAPTPKPLTPEETRAAIAEAMLNPLSNLWILFMQNDTISYGGDGLDLLNEDSKIQNITLLMPVLSMQLTQDWRLIFRPVIPFVSYDTIDSIDISSNTVGNLNIPGINFKRENGLGDIVLWSAFSNQYQPPFIWGFGPTIMLNTASDDKLGTGKNSAGPMLLAVSLTEKWVIGAVAQHWWSFSGEDTITIDTSNGPVSLDRPDVSLTDFQPIIRYRYSAVTNIGLAPNWRYNWETKQADIPVGIGFDTMVNWGGLPAKLAVEAYYFIESDDRFGPQWQIRFIYAPVVPAPAWSKKPLF